jgi:ceramide glucosyltransferase
MYEIFLFISLFGLLTSTVYLGMVLAASARFGRIRHRDQPIAPAALPPATLLKPLHGMEPHLRENLESFFVQDYPSYEIVFGMRSPDDPAMNVVREISLRHPHVPVKTVFSGEPPWPNAKVYNLNQMLPTAEHDLLVISDSDVHVGPNYLREVTRPLLNPEIGMVTCLYRGVNTGGLWSRLEALGMSVELTSGVLVADMLEGMKFALGPTMATRRDALDAIGGMPKLADYLADDFVLGQLIDACGYRVVLSDHVIDHMVINRSLYASLQHQVRWAKSTRRSRPKGHVGTGLTYSVPFALLGAVAALMHHSPVLAAAILSIGLVNRSLQCLAVGWGVVRDKTARQTFWLYPLRDLLGFIFWTASFLGSRHLIWRGSRYRLEPGGRMIREPA